MDAQDRWLSLPCTTFRASLLTPVELCVVAPLFPLSAMTGEASGGMEQGRSQDAGLRLIPWTSLIPWLSAGDWVLLLALSH